MLSGCDVVILAGGLGTRIRSVLGDTPKLLAPIGDRVVLEHMLDRLEAEGADRVVLALGHGAAAVTDFIAGRRRRAELVAMIEPAPLGTAGALRRVRAQLRPGPALVMNGDTLLDAPLAPLLVRLRRDPAPAVLLCIEVADAGRFGRVDVSADHRIVGFGEKTAAGPGLISAGAYAVSSGLLDEVAGGSAASLEREVFQAMPPGALAAEIAAGRFCDIGTPEGMQEGRRMFGDAPS